MNDRYVDERNFAYIATFDFQDIVSVAKYGFVAFKLLVGDEITHGQNFEEGQVVVLTEDMIRKYGEFYKVFLNVGQN